MSPALLLTLLLSSLLAMPPVRRLQQASWTPGALLTAWVVYVALMVMGVDGAASKYLLPVLVVLYVLPYAAGQARLERAGRLLGAARRPARARPVVNVTPPGQPTVGVPPSEPSPNRHRRKPPVEYR